jgi:hypothetical protein
MAGSRPLQGIKLFVMIAISLSLGESIILAPVTPTAPQPIPMHMLGLQKHFKLLKLFCEKLLHFCSK